MGSNSTHYSPEILGIEKYLNWNGGEALRKKFTSKSVILIQLYGAIRVNQLILS